MTRVSILPRLDGSTDGSSGYSHDRRLACPCLFRCPKPRRGVAVATRHRATVRTRSARRHAAPGPISRTACRTASDVVVPARLRWGIARADARMADAESRRARYLHAPE